MVEDIGNRKITGNFIKIKIDIRVCRPEIIEEMLVSTTSERQGRVIDRDQAGSMELKKRQGYF